MYGCQRIRAFHTPAPRRWHIGRPVASLGAALLGVALAAGCGGGASDPMDGPVDARPWTPGADSGAAPPDETEYPDSLLCPQPPAQDPRCGPPFVPDDAMPADELASRLAEGLAAWRREGKRGACASCHSPDGIDLARVGYADEDIRRRALDHVSEEDAEAIIGLIHALRQHHGMTELLHPARFRPLQPAYEPFPAAGDRPVWDPDAQSERDEAFMNHLVDDWKLLWATGRIDSLDKAHQAYDELLAMDLRHLRIGLPFDLLSEDGHYGEEHLSIFEWFPGIASTPVEADRDAFYALVDAYLADPSDRNLWAYYDAIDEMTACNPDLEGAALADYLPACEWMRLKYRSLQVFQHMLRHNTVRYPDVLADRDTASAPEDFVDNLDLVVHRQPIWEAGDFLRIQPLARPPETACDDGAHPCTLLPPFIDETIHELPTYNRARIEQSKVFQQSWFVMAWLRDPALLYQGDSFATFIGDYLEAVLLPYYDVHHAFVVAKTAVEKSAARAWMDAGGFRTGTGKIASVRSFSFKQLRDNFSPPPENDPRRATHERMFANFARMWIYLVEEDLRQTGEIFDRDEVLYAVRFMRTWIAELEGAEDPDINQLVLSIESLAQEAEELRTDENRQQNPGTGLQPNDRWGEFEAPYEG